MTQGVFFDTIIIKIIIIIFGPYSNNFSNIIMRIIQTIILIKKKNYPISLNLVFELMNRNVSQTPFFLIKKGNYLAIKFFFLSKVVWSKRITRDFEGC